MKWMRRLRCFFTLRNPLGFYYRNYEGWKEVSTSYLDDLESDEDYLLLSSSPSTNDEIAPSETINQPENSLDGIDQEISVKSPKLSMKSGFNGEDVNDSQSCSQSAVILVEKPFMSRNVWIFLRLVLQSLSLSFAISFSLSMPALLQLIPLDLRLSFINFLKPLSFVLDPLVMLYHGLRGISRIFQGYDPTWIYVMVEQVIRQLRSYFPMLPSLPERDDSWQWQSPANEIDKPQLSSHHQILLAKLHRIIPNQWIDLFLLWLLTAIPMFFFLSYRLRNQILELMPENGYLKRLRRLGSTMQDCLGLSIVGVKKNRVAVEDSLQGRFLRILRIFSKFGLLLAILIPALLGMLLAVI